MGENTMVNYDKLRAQFIARASSGDHLVITDFERSANKFAGSLDKTLRLYLGEDYEAPECKALRSAAAAFRTDIKNAAKIAESAVIEATKVRAKRSETGLVEKLDEWIADSIERDLQDRAKLLVSVKRQFAKEEITVEELSEILEKIEADAAELLEK
jgi:hypothetical protein